MEYGFTTIKSDDGLALVTVYERRFFHIQFHPGGVAGVMIGSGAEGFPSGYKRFQRANEMEPPRIGVGF